MTTYYVDQGKPGNDSWPGTEAQPWLTIGKAASTMTAGDIALIKNGTYTEMVYASNSGTPGNYITYKAYPGHTPIIDAPGTTGIDHGWGAGTGRSYLEYNGLRVTGASNSGIAIAGGSHHLRFIDMLVYGNQENGLEANGADGEDTHTLYIEGGEYYNNGLQGVIEEPDPDAPGGGHGIILYLAGADSTIIYAKCYNNGTDSEQQWSSGIEVCGPTNTDNVTIQNCECYDNDLHGIDICGSTSASLITNNVCYGNGATGIAINAGANTNVFIFNECYDNGTVTGNGWGCGIYVYNDNCDENTIAFNTVYDNHGSSGSSSGIGFQESTNVDNIVKNNIVYGNVPKNYYINHANCIDESDYNCIEDDIWYAGTLYSTLSAYQSASGLDGNSIDDDPQFVDADNADFTLERLSPCVNAGVDMGYDYYGTAPDIGANELLLSRRWMWAQGSEWLTMSGTDFMLDMCENCHITDIMYLGYEGGGVHWDSSYFDSTTTTVSGMYYMDYLVLEAGRRNIGVHVWIPVGYWGGIWNHRTAGLPAGWNTSTLSGWPYEDWMNFSLGEVRQAVADAAQDVKDNIANIAGAHLDYIRLDTGWELDDGRLNHTHVTSTVSGAKAACSGIELTVAAVQPHTEGFPGYNFDIPGTSQNWHYWVHYGYIDYAIQTNYLGPEKLEKRLGCCDTMSSITRSGAVCGITPYPDLEDTPWWMTLSGWELNLDKIINHGYEIAIFDDSRLAFSGAYQTALNERQLT